MVIGAVLGVAHGMASAADAVCRIAISAAGTSPVQFDVELALTREAQATGLMARTTLPAGHGMLFDFGSERTVAMWMKNTHLSLDMAFFDAAGALRHLARNTEPLSLALIRAPVPIRYVLEVSAGEARFLDSARGATIDLTALQDCARRTAREPPR